MKKSVFGDSLGWQIPFTYFLTSYIVIDRIDIPRKMHDIIYNEIITESGRVFRPGNKGLLENIPSDIVQEMAKRKLEEIKQYKKNQAG